MASLPNIRGRRAVDPPLGQAAERPRPDVQRLEAHGLCWLNIEGPTDAETDWLAERYGFHPLAIEDVLSRRRQRSKIDEYDGYIFIVLHFPRFDKRSGRLGAAELNLFVADALLITIQEEPLKPIGALWSRCDARPDARERYLSRDSGYLLEEVVDPTFGEC